MKKLICLVAMLFAVTNAFALPKGYTELQYIVSDGRQRIDTGVTATKNTAIETKFINHYSESTTRIVIADSWRSPSFELSIVAQTNAPLRFGNQTLTKTSFWAVNKLYTVSMNSEGISINGTLEKWSGTPGDFTSQQLRMFGVTDDSSRGAIITMYYMKIYENGSLVHNYVPAKQDSDGAIGMYDTVLQRFMANAGSGGFEAGPVASGGRSGDGKIVIATKKYNENVFAPVSQTLAGLRSNISDIVDDVYAQATDIADLNSQKQTRPATGCPAGKKCLLVKTPAGQNAWYEIADCGEDMFLSNVGSSITFGGTYYGGYKDGSTAERACAANGANCANNGWMRSFANGVVYGDAIRLSVAQSAGTVVELPSNIQNDPNGRNCLCRATGYRLKNGNSYGSMVSVTTDKWYVSHGMGYSGSTCQHNCAFDGDQQPDGGIDVPYYAAISNTCGGSVASAAMCTYDVWFASLITGSTSSVSVGYASMQAPTTGLCLNPASGTTVYTWCNSSAASNATVATSWCHEDSSNNRTCGQNSWIVRYEKTSSVSGGVNNPELYGRAFCTDLDATNISAGTVLTESQIGNKSLVGYGVTGSNNLGLACVCQLQGYKNAGNFSMNTIQNPTKYLYSGVMNGKCLQGCQGWCTDYFSQHRDNGITRELAGTCPL